jgi:hypothetical protein
MAASWRTHSAWLRREASLRGITPAWGPRGDQFFAEWLVATMEHR